MSLIKKTHLGEKKIIIILPMKVDSHFSRPTLLKLAGILKNGKTEFYFLVFFTMKNNQDIHK
jgi:hypothetical protein